ncbi:hypothetical protein MW887_007427 [Aspergillus wentii]|nr:hypothetical protein MW887_007427 [Aspergillus wentii]
MDLSAIKKRHKALLEVEDSKDVIIEELCSRIESLEKDISEKESELEDKKVIVDDAKGKSKKWKGEVDELKRERAKLSYVSVLIDGDCMNFHDTLIQKGHSGGHETVQTLLTSINAHVQDLDNPIHPIQCRIRVYANVNGLGKTYRNAGIISDEETLVSFIQGFNMENGLCDFVDAGGGKECSDVKLRALFEQDIQDTHCTRIIFCGSSDNGYARLLGPHRGCNRISLIQGPPFAWEMKELSTHFSTASFPDVFRSTKLSRRVSFSQTTPPSSPPQPAAPAAPANYASAAKATPPPQPPSPSPSPERKVPKIPILKNSYGQRIDRPLRFSTRDQVDSLKQLKLCNQYHILGVCSYGEFCSHSHEPKLSATQVEDLK